MTAGLLGRRRTFVPTRWAITAVDYTISRHLINETARFPPIEEIRLFTGELFGNRIVCMLVPGDWKFEMIEIWERHSLWGQETEIIVRDGEGMKKKGYSPIAGAYYSARLATGEYLRAIQRSARVIVIRSISGEYWAPLGTWVVREAARKAMKNPAVPAETLQAAVRMATGIIGSDSWVPYSSLIPELRTQRTLSHF